MTRTEELMADVTGALSSAVLAVTALVLLMGLVHAARAGRSAGPAFAASVGLALEFLLAGGLVRLSGLESLTAVGMVAGIVVVRIAIRRGIALSAMAADFGATPAFRARTRG